jgi:hypothetical protein
MIPFLALLQGAGGAASALGGAGGAAGAGSAGAGGMGGMGRLGQAIGTQGAGRTEKSDKKMGLQFANAGLEPPQVPNMMNMLQGAMSMTQQQGGSRGLPVTQLMNMLRGGQ